MDLIGVFVIIIKQPLSAASMCGDRYCLCKIGIAYCIDCVLCLIRNEINWKYSLEIFRSLQITKLFNCIFKNVVQSSVSTYVSSFWEKAFSVSVSSISSFLSSSSFDGFEDEVTMRYMIICQNWLIEDSPLVEEPHLSEKWLVIRFFITSSHSYIHYKMLIIYRSACGQNTDKSRGFGFVTFETEEAQKAIRELHGVAMEGRPLTVWPDSNSNSTSGEDTSWQTAPPPRRGKRNGKRKHVRAKIGRKVLVYVGRTDGRHDDWRR